MSIRTRMTLFFLVAFIIPAMSVVTLLYTATRKTLRDRSVRELHAINAWKKDKIETYFSLTLNILSDLQGFLTLRQNIPLLIEHAGDPAHPDYAAAKARLDERMGRYQKNYGYTAILVTDTNGRVLYASSGTTRVGEPLPGAPGQAFETGTKGPGFNDVFLDPRRENRPFMLGSGRFTDFDGRLIGVVAIEMDMQKIYDILEVNTGLGSTAESYIGKKDGGGILYLSPLREDPSSALKRRYTLRTKGALPLQLAFETRSDGVGFEQDYRNKKVVAAWHYIPMLSWALATKVDESEAFAAVIRLKQKVLGLGLLIVLLGVSAALLLSRSITAPVKRLEEGARIIGSGKLDHTVGTAARDEIGSLSRTFDQMARNLKVVYGELTEANKSLKNEMAERIKAEEQVKALTAQQAQMKIAREIQQGLFPQQAPRVPGWDLAGMSRSPEDTGGDYFDYIPMAGGGTAVVVGDVSGHGVGPALLMASTRQCLHALSLTLSDIAGVLDHASRLMKDDFGEDKFLTLCMAQLDPDGSRIRYLSAGHPHALLFDREGRLKRTLPTNFPGLCRLLEMPTPVTEGVEIAPGDVLLLLTDGILEARSPDGEEFGEERVAEAVAPLVSSTAEVIVKRLFEAVASFTSQAEMQDDMTSLVIKRAEARAPHA